MMTTPAAQLHVCFVIVLRSPRALVVMGRATGQLSTRSDAKYFSANAAAFLD